jgi:integrase
MKTKPKKKARYGSGSLGLRGSIWHIAYREVKRNPGGKSEYIRHRESSGSTDRDFAQRLLNKKLQEIGGRRPRVVDPNEITYEQLRDAYEEECIRLNRRMVRRGKMHFTRTDKFFGGWRVKDFTVVSLKKFRQECLRTGLTDATTNRHMAGLRRMFTLAVENELLETVDIPSHFPMVKEPNKNPNAIFIKDEWYPELTKRLTEPLRSAFVQCYHTGVRVEEMKRILWQYVDLPKGKIHLPGEITKNGEPRDIFIPDDFNLKPGKPDELVFPLGETQTRSEWQRVCVGLGIAKYRCRRCGATEKCAHLVRLRSYEGPHLRHTRHTAARNMEEADIPRDRAREIMGHKTDAMYTRYNIGKERDIDDARLLSEQAHRKRQSALRKRR